MLNTLMLWNPELPKGDVISYQPNLYQLLIRLKSSLDKHLKG